MRSVTGLLSDMPEWLCENLAAFLEDNEELELLPCGVISLRDVDILRRFFLDVYCVFSDRSTLPRAAVPSEKWAEVLMEFAALNSDFYQVKSLCSEQEILAANAALEFTKSIAHSLGIDSGGSPAANLVKRSYLEQMPTVSLSEVQALFADPSAPARNWDRFASQLRSTPRSTESVVARAIEAALASTSKVSSAARAGLGKDMADSALSYQNRLRALTRLKKALDNSSLLRKIVEITGRLKKSVLTDERPSLSGAFNPSSGSEIGKMLPREMALSDILLQAKIADSSLAVNDPVAQKESQGAVVFLLDCSGSMIGERDANARAVALVSLSKANQKNRPFCLICYNNFTRKIVKIPGSPVSDLLDAICYGSGGGTNWMDPLDKALDVIEAISSFNSADIIFVSDGVGEISNEWLSSEFEPRKKSLGIRSRGVLIGDASDKEAVKAMARVTDSIVCISSMSDVGAQVDAITADI